GRGTGPAAAPRSRVATSQSEPPPPVAARPSPRPGPGRPVPAGAAARRGPPGRPRVRTDRSPTSPPAAACRQVRRAAPAAGPTPLQPRADGRGHLRVPLGHLQPAVLVLHRREQRQRDGRLRRRGLDRRGGNEFQVERLPAGLGERCERPPPPPPGPPLLAPPPAPLPAPSPGPPPARR